MGKSRRTRPRGGSRPDPMTQAARPVKPPTDPELAALREKSVLPVINDLRSPEPKLRSAAAGAVANIVQDAKCRKLLLREQVVHTVLTETLTDSSVESRAAGWAILDVLAREEESDFCVHLFRSDVLTAAEHAASLIHQTLTSTDPPFEKANASQKDFLWRMTGSLVSVLGALAEARDEICEAMVAKPSVLGFLTSLVSSQHTPWHVLQDVLLCLIALCEDNQQASEVIAVDANGATCYQILLKLIQGENSKTVLACELLHTVFSSLSWHDSKPGPNGVSDAILVPVLTKALVWSKQEETSAPNDRGLSYTERLIHALETVASIGTDLQIAIESGNRAAPGAEPEWNGISDDRDDQNMADGGVDMDIDEEMGDNAADADLEGSGDDDSEMDDDAIEADMDLVLGTEDDEPVGPDLDDLPTLRELIRLAIPKLLELLDIAHLSEFTAEIQTRSLAALNNIAWTVSCLDFSDKDNKRIFRAWAPTACKIWARVVTPALDNDTADLELATQVAGIAWAISRVLGGHTPMQSGSQVRQFINLYHASQKVGSQTKTQEKGQSKQEEHGDDPLQGLGVKCIGVLGQAAQDPADVEINREVGVFLVSVIAGLPATPAAEAVEALNQLFDIYGDEDLACDKEVFWKNGFLKHFEETLPKARTMAKSINKQRNEELRLRADEVVLNLGRFIDYKKKHKPE